MNGRAAGSLRRAVDLAADQATVAHRARLLPGEVVDALAAAGFFRHFTPARWGGAAGNFTDLLHDVAEVGTACGAASWYAALGAAVSRIAAHLPEEGQRAIWSDGPNVLLAGALVPAGRAEPVPGGWRLSGRWPYVSAVEHARYTLARSTTAAGESRFFVLPRNAYRTVDTWRSPGMRATASNSLEAADVFVADAHTFPAVDLVEGRCRRDGESYLRVPLRAVNGLSFAGPMLGAARGVLAEWWKLVGAGATEPYRAEAAARSEGEIDAAALLLDRTARTADDGSVSPREKLRAGRDCALAAELLVTSVGRLVGSAGTRGQTEDGRMHRLATDVVSASTHTMLRFGPAAEAYVWDRAGA